LRNWAARRASPAVASARLAKKKAQKNVCKASGVEKSRGFFLGLNRSRLAAAAEQKNKGKGSGIMKPACVAGINL
jgi:hypothetical protein